MLNERSNVELDSCGKNRNNHEGRQWLFLNWRQEECLAAHLDKIKLYATDRMRKEPS